MTETRCNTRAAMIENGLLIDVTKTAAEAGFVLPVGITKEAWDDCIKWSDEDTDLQTYQDESGRLWDVLWMSSLAARENRNECDVNVHVYRVPRDGKSRHAQHVCLRMLVGPGDHGEPVIYIDVQDEPLVAA